MFDNPKFLNLKKLGKFLLVNIDIQTELIIILSEIGKSCVWGDQQSKSQPFNV